MLCLAAMLPIDAAVQLPFAYQGGDAVAAGQLYTELLRHPNGLPALLAQQARPSSQVA